MLGEPVIIALSFAKPTRPKVSASAHFDSCVSRRLCKIQRSSLNMRTSIFVLLPNPFLQLPWRSTLESFFLQREDALSPQHGCRVNYLKRMPSGFRVAVCHDLKNRFVHC